MQPAPPAKYAAHVARLHAALYRTRRWRQAPTSVRIQDEAPLAHPLVPNLTLASARERLLTQTLLPFSGAYEAGASALAASAQSCGGLCGRRCGEWVGVGVLIATEDSDALSSIRDSAEGLGVDVMVVDERHPRPNLRISLPMAVVRLFADAV